MNEFVIVETGSGGFVREEWMRGASPVMFFLARWFGKRITRFGKFQGYELHYLLGKYYLVKASWSGQ